MRQDVLIDGIKANRKQRNLYLIEVDMNSRSDDIGTSNCNVFLEYNTKIYLTECLVFSHRINRIFQSEMKNCFSSFISIVRIQ